MLFILTYVLTVVQEKEVSKQKQYNRTLGNINKETKVRYIFLINPNLEMNIVNDLDFLLSLSYYLRKTEYDYWKDVNPNTFELKFGLKYSI